MWWLGDTGQICHTDVVVNALAIKEKKFQPGKPVMAHGPANANDFEVQLNAFHVQFSAPSVLCLQPSASIEAQTH